MRRKLILILIVLIAFSLPLCSHAFILANAESDSEMEYLTIELKRMVYKGGAIENRLIFDFDLEKRSAWSKEDVISDESFGVQAQRSLDNIKNLFENQERIITFEDKIRIEIILAQYSSHTEESLRGGETDFDKPSLPNIKKGAAYNKYLSTRALALSSIDGVIKECVDIALATYGLHVGSVMYVETYGYPYSFKKIDSNADEKFFDSQANLNIHRFHATASELNEKKVSFVQRVPNTAFWYGLTIAITVSALLCLIVFIYFKKKKIVKI